MAGGAAVAGPRVRCDLVHDDGTDMDHEHDDRPDIEHDLADLLRLRHDVCHGLIDYDIWLRRLNAADDDVRAAYWRTVLAGHGR